VASAARRLDKKQGEWFREVSLREFDMASCDNCILGQVFQHFSAAPFEMQNMKAFARDLRGDSTDMKKLARAWKAEINRRLK
jgi:hypothetical protein